MYVFWAIVAIIIIWSVVKHFVDKHRQKLRDQAAFEVAGNLDTATLVSEIVQLGPSIMPDEVNEKVKGRGFIHQMLLEKNDNRLKCPNDGGTLIPRSGRYGAFWGCANYPSCSYTKNKL
ncbi:MAG: topoisomerase DNA-binding C4 zinc finger domain-containing protein [Patescibacteria group bacterium]|jgi:hypothetical protein